MKRISIFILITLIAVAAIAAPGRRPQQGQMGPGPNEILPPPQFADFLGLTDAQTAQIEPLREKLRTTIEPLREQQRANQEQIRAAVESGNSAQAGALAVANYNLRQQIKAAHDSFATSFEAILTAAQKAKFDVYQEIPDLRRERERPE